MNGPSAWTPD